MRARLLTILGVLLAWPATGRSHPVSYKGAVSVMAWNQPDATDWMTTYTFDRDAAVAARFLRLPTEMGEARAGLLQLNGLAKRWNGLGHQGNVYVSIGAGAAEQGHKEHHHVDDERDPATFASVQADHESRRHLVMAEGNALKPSGGPALCRWEVRAGLAPYLSRYDEPSAWLILSVQGQPQADRDVTFTPLLRVFYRNVLAEAGASAGGGLTLNFMVHF